MADVVDVAVAVDMIVVIVVVFTLNGRVCWSSITLATACTTSPGCRVDTGEAFLDATATYRRGPVAFEVFAAAFVAGEGRGTVCAGTRRRRVTHRIRFRQREFCR